MGRRLLALLALLSLPACDASLCPADRLSPVPAGARWIVRANDRPTFTPPPEIPGEETFADPAGTETYAGYALYDEAGALLAPRWLDSLTRWEGATGAVSAADRLASASPAGQVQLLLAEGRRPAVTFTLADGAVESELAPHLAPPEAAGQLVDAARAGDRVLATRRRWPGGGGDVVLFDVSGARILEVLPLRAPAGGVVEPGRIARLDDARFAIGLDYVEPPARGAIAIVDLDTLAVTRVDVPGLTGCLEVAPTPAGAVAVLCRGALDAPPGERDAGLAVLRAEDEVPSVEVRRARDAALSRRAPVERLVPLVDGWVAARVAGDPATGDGDAVLALDLDSDAAALLTQGFDDGRFGAPIGGGDFGAGELWWATVGGGVLRWRVEGSGREVTFTALPPAAPHGCDVTPPRDVRYLPSP